MSENFETLANHFVNQCTKTARLAVNENKQNKNIRLQVEFKVFREKDSEPEITIVSFPPPVKITVEQENEKLRQELILMQKKTPTMTQS